MRIVSTAIPAALPLVSRRSLMLGAAALPLALGACASVTDPATGKIDPAKIDRALKLAAADAKVIAGSLKSVLAQLSALDIPGLTPKVLEIAGIAIAGVTDTADALQAVTSIAAAQPLVKKLVTYAQAFAASLATLPLPKEVTMTLRAAVILLPVVEATVDLVVNRLPETSEIEGARAVLVACAAR